MLDAAEPRLLAYADEFDALLSVVRQFEIYVGTPDLISSVRLSHAALNASRSFSVR
jgi:hypothetical protein